MAYRKRVRKDTADKRPEKMQDGKVNEMIGASLASIQDQLNISNDTMAEILNCSGTYYDKVLSGEKGLTTDKLSRLYYSLSLEMNHLIGNDSNYPPIRKEGSSANEMGFEELLGALIKNIENTDGHNHRLKKIMKVYNDFGKMIAMLMNINDDEA